MLPLRDTEPTRYGAPRMTQALILANVIAFPAMILLFESSSEAEVLAWLYVPKMVGSQQGAGVVALLISTFTHAGIMHLVGNMWFFWIFGPRIEDVCGPWRFLAFYLVCALTAGILYSFVHSGDEFPVVGASGAISGMMGAYLILFPFSRMGLPIISRRFPRFPRIPAGFVVLFYLVIDLWWGVFAVQNGTESTTAYWAHLGGFFGALFVFFFLRSEVFARYLSDAKLVR